MCLGILVQRWRILLRPIAAEPKKCTLLVKAMCVLHNYLSVKRDPTYAPNGFADTTGPNGEVREGFWRCNAVPPLTGLELTSRSMSAAAIEVRERLRHYFMSHGNLNWQLDYINRR